MEMHEAILKAIIQKEAQKMSELELKEKVVVLELRVKTLEENVEVLSTVMKAMTEIQEKSKAIGQEDVYARLKEQYTK